MKLLDYTPVEQYEGVLVKREDTCCSEVPLSKVRGALPHIQKRSEKTIVCIDTWRSLNGLVTAAVCQSLGKQCIVAYPIYKRSHDVPLQQQMAASLYGAELLPIPAGRQRIMRYRLLKQLGSPNGLFGQAYYIMPDAFKLPETVDAVREQYLATVERCGRPDHVIVPTGTGTHLKGLLAGSKQELIWAVLGYSVKLPFSPTNLRIIDNGFVYTDQDLSVVPFPANSYYESKAWSWLQSANLHGTVLFWNIGSGLDSRVTYNRSDDGRG